MNVPIDPAQIVLVSSLADLKFLQKAINEELQALKAFKANNPVLPGETSLAYTKRMRAFYPDIRLRFLFNAYSA